MCTSAALSESGPALLQAQCDRDVEDLCCKMSLSSLALDWEPFPCGCGEQKHGSVKAAGGKGAVGHEAKAFPRDRLHC